MDIELIRRISHRRRRSLSLHKGERISFVSRKRGERLQWRRWNIKHEQQNRNQGQHRSRQPLPRPFKGKEPDQASRIHRKVKSFIEEANREEKVVLQQNREVVQPASVQGRDRTQSAKSQKQRDPNQRSGFLDEEPFFRGLKGKANKEGRTEALKR